MKIEKHPEQGKAGRSDNSLTVCRGDDNASSASETSSASGDASLRPDSLRGSAGQETGARHNASSASETNSASGDASLRADSLREGAGGEAGPGLSLPRDARLPINRCNLPAVVLGGLTFQQHPGPLLIDGVAELHADLFRRLALAPPELRGEVFRDYMTVRFQLEWLEEMGYTGHASHRAKANYIRMIRGWSFDSDSREGAVLRAGSSRASA